MILKYQEAIRRAIDFEMQSNNSVVLFGEDIVDNVYGYSEGLKEKFGEERVKNIPLSEASVMGLACGAALTGMRPIVDITLPNFLYITMDQVCNMIAKICYMYNGKLSVPMTILYSSMQGSGNAAQHSDRLHSMLATVPGLKVICPSSPQDMYSMLRAAIQDENPVVCCTDRNLFWQEEEVNLEVVGEIGKPKIICKGNDITIVGISGTVRYIKELLPLLKEEGISAEVIDIRTTNPLDMKFIISSVRSTGRLLICDTDSKSGSIANAISSTLYKEAFLYLKCPIFIEASADVPIPFAQNLEQEVLVSREKIYSAIIELLNFKWNEGE